MKLEVSFVIASQIVSTCLCLLLRWIYFDASDKIFPHHIPFSSQQFPRDNRNNPPVDKSADDEDTVSPPRSTTSRQIEQMAGTEEKVSKSLLSCPHIISQLKIILPNHHFIETIQQFIRIYTRKIRF